MAVQQKERQASHTGVRDLVSVLRFKNRTWTTTLALCPRSTGRNDLTKCEILACISRERAHIISVTAENRKKFCPFAPQLLLLIFAKSDATLRKSCRINLPYRVSEKLFVFKEVDGRMTGHSSPAHNFILGTALITL